MPESSQFPWASTAVRHSLVEQPSKEIFRFVPNILWDFLFQFLSDFFEQLLSFSYEFLFGESPHHIKYGFTFRQA